MTRGKQTCKILKEIRRQIAEANGIEFATQDCRYKGDCPGTCPKCEAEVRYLEQQLNARSKAGKNIVLAGISAGMILMSGCTNSKSDRSSETLQINSNDLSEWIAEWIAERIDNINDSDTEEELCGEVPCFETEDTLQIITKDNVTTSESTEMEEPEDPFDLLIKKDVTTGEVAIIEEPADTIQTLTKK